MRRKDQEETPQIETGVVVCDHNPSTSQTEVGGLQVPGQPGTQQDPISKNTQNHKPKPNKCLLPLTDSSVC
jgi:hypothetical protein